MANKDNKWDLGSILALIGSFIVLLYSIYYMQNLSYTFGFYSGTTHTLSSYNITPSTALATALSQSSTLSLGLHLTYALIVFALIMGMISVLWFFSKSYGRYTPEILIFSALVYLIIVVILEYNFNFSAATNSYGSFLGVAFIFIAGAYFIINSRSRTGAVRRPVSQIPINPDTPYSNMKTISNRLMSKLTGDLKILDMHFDAVGMDNLMQLLDKNFERYSRVDVLTKKDRLGDSFLKSYKDFKIELQNRNVIFELRILNDKEASRQHERVIMDASTAYKIPPLNIINKKNEHIVSIKHSEALRKFNELWAEATKFENLISESNNLQ